jgi:Ca2+-binding RTX toxin-like protein
MPSTQLGSEFLVNSTTPGLQFAPAMAGLTNGRFVAVWIDNSNSSDDPSGSAVRGQLFDPGGTPLSPEFLVNNFTSDNQTDATVAALTNGRFVVTWADASGTAGDTDGYAIHARVFDGNGAKSGIEFLVPTTTAGDQFDPAASGLPNGGFVVAWADTSANPNDEDVRACIYNANGSPVGPEFLVNTVTAGRQLDPAITVLTDGRFVITWTDASGSAGDTSIFGIHARLFSATGAPSGPEFLVNSEIEGRQVQPTVAQLADGRIVFMWIDGSDPNGTTIRARVFDSDSTPSGTDFIVHSDLEGNQTQPSIAALADGRFAAVWTDDNPASNTSDVRLIVFNADGSTWQNETTVNAAIQGRYSQPTVTALADGRFVLAWQDPSQTLGDASGSAIHARIFDLRSEGINLTGTPVLDEYIGSGFADVINGAGGNDQLIGAAGNDTLVGGAGDDQLDGGQGIDTALYSGARSAYEISHVGGHVQIIGPDGSDVLVNTEVASFSDGVIQLDAENRPPEITSNSGGVNAIIAVAENVRTVTDVDASDPDQNPLSYSISGGADAARFQINSTTGALSFVALPDFEVPTDADHNNTYVVTVRASDGTLFDDQTVTVNVGNVTGVNLNGDANDNRIVGTLENDTMHGGAGNDRLVAGGGGDLLFGEGGFDWADYLADDGGVTVDLATGTANDGLVDSLNSIEGIIGSTYDDVIRGDNGVNNLQGAGGNDVIEGRLGNDRLEGGGGNDVLVGGAGDDELIGQTGIDTVDYSSSIGGAGVTVDLRTEKATGGAGNDRVSEIENARGSSFDDILRGSDVSNQLVGYAGNDALYGFGGNDALDGGDGDDTIVGGTGTDGLSGGAGNDTFVWNSGDGGDDMLGGSGTDTIDHNGSAAAEGYEIASTLGLLKISSSSGGPDVSTFLTGVERIDLDTGAGDDQVYIADALTGAGISSVTVTLGAGNDHLVADALGVDMTAAGQDGNDSLAGGTGNDKLSGNTGDDVLSGGAGNDTLQGGLGNDSLGGGAGTDTAVFANAIGSYGFSLNGTSILVIGEGTDTVLDDIEVFQFANGTRTRAQVLGELLSPAFTENADTVMLPTAGGTFSALGGDDKLAYRGDFATIDGGAGSDTLDFSAFGCAVWVDFARPETQAWTRDRGDVDAGPGSWRAIADLSNLESLVGTIHSDKVYGNADDNTFFYNGGFDVLDGRGGSDTADFSLFGSAVWVDLTRTSSGDSEAWTRDRTDVNSGPGAWRAIADLAALENLTGTAYADKLFGDDGANRLSGGDGDDVLDGRGGNDILCGGPGIDRLTGGAGNDVFYFNNPASGFMDGDTITDFQSIESPNTGDTVVIAAGYESLVLGNGSTTITYNGVTETIFHPGVTLSLANDLLVV